jgi:S1-C subfamily serine protease
MAAALWLICAPVAAQEKVTQSIVKIEATYNTPDYFRPWQMKGQRNRIGSGSIISENLILTNAHVVSDATFIRVRRAAQADKFVAKVTAVSHELDLAILAVADRDFFADAPPLEIGDLPRVGEKVYAYGFPKGGTRITITEGIVSRIERTVYSHSQYQNLVCQIDAAINPGSSGGPVISDGKIVGVIFQSTRGQNIGYMVPAPVIRHFFQDLTDGRHDGAPTIFFVWQNLENPQMRAYLKMRPDQSGILVKEVSPPFVADDLLKPGDVILAIDGFDIANDGTIALRPSDRISFEFTLDQKQIGESVSLQLLRDGRILSRDTRLEHSRAVTGYLVPRIRYEIQPTYYIIGGLAFTPLTGNYIRAWGKWSNVPLRLQSYYRDIITTENQDRQEVVVLMDVLSDEVNVGYDMFKNWVVSEVNGSKINSMADLVATFENHQGAYHRIGFEDHNAEIVLETAGLEEKSRNILENYRVTADRSNDLMPQPDQRK